MHHQGLGQLSRVGVRSKAGVYALPTSPRTPATASSFTPKGAGEGGDALAKPKFWKSRLQARRRGRGLHTRARASEGRGGAFPVARVALRSPPPAARICEARAARLSAVRLHRLKSPVTLGRRPRHRGSSTRPRSSFCVRALVLHVLCHSAAIVCVSWCGAAGLRSPSLYPPRRSATALTRTCVARLKNACGLQMLGGSAVFAVRAPPFLPPLLRLLRLRSASTPQLAGFRRGAVRVPRPRGSRTVLRDHIRSMRGLSKWALCVRRVTGGSVAQPPCRGERCARARRRRSVSRRCRRICTH